jgi:formylglycine-generating enzyme required for sulfatase activity
LTLDQKCGDYAGDLDKMASYSNNSESKTHPVAQKQMNAWGLYDMHGNVWEWCQDRHDASYNKNSPKDDPMSSTRIICSFPIAGQQRNHNQSYESQRYGNKTGILRRNGRILHRFKMAFDTETIRFLETEAPPAPKSRLTQEQCLKAIAAAPLQQKMNWAELRKLTREL